MRHALLIVVLGACGGSVASKVPDSAQPGVCPANNPVSVTDQVWPILADPEGGGFYGVVQEGPAGDQLVRVEIDGSVQGRLVIPASAAGYTLAASGGRVAVGGSALDGSPPFVVIAPADLSSSITAHIGDASEVPLLAFEGPNLLAFTRHTGGDGGGRQDLVRLDGNGLELRRASVPGALNQLPMLLGAMPAPHVILAGVGHQEYLVGYDPDVQSFDDDLQPVEALGSLATTTTRPVELADHTIVLSAAGSLLSPTGEIDRYDLQGVPLGSHQMNHGDSLVEVFPLGTGVAVVDSAGPGPDLHLLGADLSGQANPVATFNDGEGIWALLEWEHTLRVFHQADDGSQRISCYPLPG